MEVTDEDIVNRPTDTFQVEVAVAVALVFDVLVLGRQRLNDHVLVPVVRDYLTHLLPGESSSGPSRRRSLAENLPA